MELVDVGERFPFYEDFIKGTTTAVVTPESRTRTQLCLIGDFIHTHVDLSVLRNLWARVGSYTNHQAAFCDFDWGEERLSVRIVIQGTSLRIDLLELTLFCPIQAIFQHILNSVMGDVAEQIMTQQCFGIEFENEGVYRYMSARFWKGTELCRIYICRSSLPSIDLAGEMWSLSRLLSVASTHCEIVACSGCPVDMIQVIDCSLFFTHGVQSCFRFESLDLRYLMHKSNYSVFGHIDFFSVLQALLVSLGGSLNEEWALRSPELSKVNNFPHVFSWSNV